MRKSNILYIVTYNLDNFEITVFKIEVHREVSKIIIIQVKKVFLRNLMLENRKRERDRTKEGKSTLCYKKLRYVRPLFYIHGFTLCFILEIRFGNSDLI